MKITKDLSIGPFFTFKEAKKEPVYNWFYYKEGFSPQLIRMLIKKYKPKFLFDPFCGSGTSLLVAKEHSIKSLGIDASQLAVFVSNTKTRNYSDMSHVMNYFKKIENKPYDWHFNLLPLNKIFPPRNLKEILAIRARIEEIENKQDKDFCLLCLISILPMVSFIKKDGGVLKIVKKNLPSAKQLFKRKLKRMINEKIIGPEPIVYLGDARKEIIETDFIITSPPYLNNVDYSKVYGLELSLLGQHKPDLLTSFIKKDKTPLYIEEAGPISVKIPVVGHYFHEMKLVLKNMYSSLSPKGIACIVIGNSVINKNHILVDEILASMAEAIGFEAEIIIGKFRLADVKPFKIKTRESLLILKKSG